MSQTIWVPLTLTSYGMERSRHDVVLKLCNYGIHNAVAVQDMFNSDIILNIADEDWWRYCYHHPIFPRLLLCRIDSKSTKELLLKIGKSFSRLFTIPDEEDWWIMGSKESYRKFISKHLNSCSKEHFRASRLPYKDILLEEQLGKSTQVDVRYNDIEEDSTLRSYQIDAKEAILNSWQHVNHIMVQMPMGTGKTRLFVSLIADIQQVRPQSRVLIVTHRKELVEQISQSLTEHYHIAHGILSGKLSRNIDEAILVSSIQTLNS